MTTLLPSKTGNILLASYNTGNPFEIDAGTVILAHSGVAIYGNASQVFTLSNAGSVYGYSDGIALNLGGSITNAETGQISSNGAAVEIAGGVGHLANYGTLLSRTDDVVVLEGGGGTVTNYFSGTISGAFVGGAGSDAVFITGGAGTVVNDGAITQAAKVGQIRNGVLLNAGGALTNHATGTITAGTFGVEVRNAAGTVVNSGSIAGARAGVGLYDGGGVTNLSVAITGGAGVYVTGATGTIANGAVITGSAGAGVYLKAGGRVSNLGSGAKIGGARDGVAIAGGPGTVQNSGSITGSLDIGVALSGGGYVNNVGAASTISGAVVGVGVWGGTGTVSNAATIRAAGTAGVGVEFYDTAGVFANTVINNGTIAGGTSGDALLFGAGDDRLVIDPGAVFTGAVDGGGGTNALELAKGAASGSFSGLGSSSFTNFQHVNVDAGAVWTLAGINTLVAGATLTNRGRLNLSGGSWFAGSVVNFGTISGAMTESGVGTVGRITNAAGATIIGAAVAIDAALSKALTLTNAGTISASTKAVQFGAGGDRLVFDPGATFLGVVDGGGGVNTLELAKGAVAGSLTGLGVEYENFQDVIVDAGATWKLFGSNTVSAAGQLTDNGTLSQAAGGVLTVSDGGAVKLLGGVANAGTIMLASAAANTDLRVQGAVATLFGGGTVSMTGTRARVLGATSTATLVNVDNTIVGAGSVGANSMLLVNLAGGVIKATGALTIRDAPAGTVTNAGLIEAVTAGTMALVADTIDQSAGGTILAAGAGLVTLQGVSVVGGTLATLNASRISVNGGASNLNGTAVSIGAGGLLQVTTGGALSVDGTVTNLGLVQANGGTLSLGGAVMNSGTLAARTGVLQVLGTVIGLGVVNIAGGEADFGAALAENVTFTSAGGILGLYKSTGYTGQITGFSKTGTTSLDLLDVAFGGATTATFSGTTASGSLTITDGTNTARLTLLGNYTASTFAVASDGRGGTLVVDPSALASHAPLAPLVTAMAGFGARSSFSGAIVSRPEPPSMHLSSVASTKEA